MKFPPKIITVLLFTLPLLSTQPVNAYSVCGLKREEASFKTKSYLITICPGEASYQMIITYPDGTGYKRISAQKEGNKYRGSTQDHNYIIDPKQLIIGTDGQDPLKEKVVKK